MDVGSIPISSTFYLNFLRSRIRGRVVEGTGLIIRFPMERHWFEPSRMQIIIFLYCVFFFFDSKIIITIETFKV